MPLDWRGGNLKRKVKDAQRFGVDETMSACVLKAKGRVQVRTGTLQGSIRMEPAADEGHAIVGRWGSFGVAYALAQETGPISASFSWGFNPFLRPTADEEYPKLADRIRKAYGG